MLTKRNNYKKFFLLIYMFLIIYAPPILKNVNTILIVFAFTFLVLLLKYRSEVVNILKNSNVKKILLLFFLYFSWYAISVLLNFIFFQELYIKNIFINLYSMGLVLFPCFTCVIFVFVYSNKNKISFNEIIKIIIYAGLIQSFICILSFLFPPVKSFLIELLYNLTNDKVFLNEYHIARRFYGYSNGLVDAYGFGSGIIACLPLFYSMSNSKKILITLPFLLTIVILNSRTGIIIFAIGLFIFFISLFKKNKTKEFLPVISYSILLSIVVVIIVYIFNPTTINWIVTDFLSFFNARKFGTADILFSEDFWRLPDGIRLLIGAGYSISSVGGVSNILGFTSDVGYINEIWKTGIIGLGILLFVLMYLIYLSIKNGNSKNSHIFIFFLIAILVGNIKLNIFVYNPGTVVIILYILYELYFSKENNKTIVNLKKIKKNMNNKISIIVPIYNADKYLKKCLDSIINQTYKNLEIILIDDGSVDNSLKICKDYAKKDKRIIVFSQKNKGQACARNYGLNIATGDYIGFVDSDDWIDLDMFEYLYNLIVKYGADCSYIKIRKKKYDIQAKKIIESIYKDEDILIEYLKFGMKTGEYAVYTYLYKREIIENVRFPEGRINEDIPFLYCVLENAKILVKSNKHCYNYRLSENSTTRSYFKKKDFDLIEASNDLINYSKNKSKKIQKLAKIKRYRSDFSLLAKIAYYGLQKDDDFSEEIRLLKKNIRKNYFSLLFSNMKFTRKLQLTAFVINYKFSTKAINFIKKGKI